MTDVGPKTKEYNTAWQVQVGTRYVTQIRNYELSDRNVLTATCYDWQRNRRIGKETDSTRIIEQIKNAHDISLL